ncbi:hypothetical protein [Limnobacter sp.]|uniref:hypothetical protein n=1 Tax=Limnobacter sp. TaxID=2003368 RepID=UPI003BAD4A72
MKNAQKPEWANSSLSPEVQLAHKLLTMTAPRLSDDFSGIGIVFYHSLASLSFLPLKVVEAQNWELPVAGLNEISDVLAKTARTSSSWHDGFHFVHANSVCLTHLCQFIAPPLPITSGTLPSASGARHMTALLASKVEGIVTVGLLTQERAVSIYRFGILTLNEAV